MKKVLNTRLGITAISFKSDINYELLFSDSEFFGVRVETSEERITYSYHGTGDSKLTDDILKSALKSFAELDFHNFDIIVNSFLSKNPKQYALAQEVVKEKIEQLSNSITANSLKHEDEILITRQNFERKKENES